MGIRQYIILIVQYTFEYEAIESFDQSPILQGGKIITHEEVGLMMPRIFQVNK